MRDARCANRPDSNPESRTPNPVATHTAYIALGSNLGDRWAHLDGAIAALREHPAIDVTNVSTWIVTQPEGGPPNAPDFLNGAAELRTSLAPHDLLAALQAIEQEFGRQRSQPNAPRTLDLDLLLYDDLVLDEPDLTIPHPRMIHRRFVLEPLAEIAPTVRHPATNLPIETLLKQCMPSQ
jgi:2-amino-4-hydroxy-6-hydroxymethyldihydropteridine diphosphokinase